MSMEYINESITMDISLIVGRYINEKNKRYHYHCEGRTLQRKNAELVGKHQMFKKLLFLYTSISLHYTLYFACERDS